MVIRATAAAVTAESNMNRWVSSVINVERVSRMGRALAMARERSVGGQDSRGARARPDPELARALRASRLLAAKCEAPRCQSPDAPEGPAS